MKQIAVVFITDDGYSVPTNVTISSLVENKRESTEYKIYIIAPELTEQNREFFLRWNRKKGIRVELIFTSMEKYQNVHRWGRNSYCQATEAALLKFEIPRLLPEESKVIYLDGDIICRSGLDGIDETKLGDKYAAAVMDSGKLYSGRELVRKCKSYFNTGVMLLNLDRMRADNITEKLYQTKLQMKDNALMDQDVFNLVFGDRVKLLPVKYNFLYINLLRAQERDKFDMKMLNEMYGTRYESLDDIRGDSVVIHFASEDKPWKNPEIRLAAEWRRYFDNSSVCGETEYLLTQQNLWLKKKLTAEKRELAGKRKRLSELERENRKLRENVDLMWKSASMKAGRFLTFLPRLIVRQTEKWKERHKYLRWRIPRIGGLNRGGRERKLIVSMTTFGSRLKTVDITIGTLLRQTMKPDRIEVYLAEDEFGGKLPWRLGMLQKLCGVEFVRCKDLKSPHMKYYYAMQRHPEDILITVDDDIIYRRDLIRQLYDMYTRYPQCVSAMRVHRMRFASDGNLLGYNKWKMRDSGHIGEPRMDLFATGVGGVLYPPHLMYGDIFDWEVIQKTSLKADDVWLKLMEVLNGTKVVLAGKQEGLTYIDGTQETGLFNSNVFGDKNDEQILAVLNYYGKDELVRRLREI